MYGKSLLLKLVDLPSTNAICYVLIALVICCMPSSLDYDGLSGVLVRVTCLWYHFCYFVHGIASNIVLSLVFLRVLRQALPVFFTRNLT